MTEHRATPIIEEARRLRDYLLHTGLVDQDALIKALAPFDSAEGRDLTDEDHLAVFRAFQTVVKEATEVVDHYTLNAVLAGRSPFAPNGSRAVASLGFVTLMLSGIALVALTLHFSLWSSRTSFWLAESERFTAFDHFSEVMRLIELAQLFGTTGEATGPERLQPYALYLEGETSLRAFYVDEEKLPEHLATQFYSVDPRDAFYGWVSDIAGGVRRPICGVLMNARNAEDEAPPGVALVLGCEAPPSSSETRLAEAARTDPPPWDAGAGLGAAVKPGFETATDEETVKRMAQQTPRAQDAPEVDDLAREAFEELHLKFLSEKARVEALRREIMQAAGRRLAGDVSQSRDYVEQTAENLREYLNVVHRWVLPILYGALGSIVYCMWRVLTPHTVAYGPVFVLMRTAFAGLAALTLSMIILPSEVLTLGVSTTTPIIYLLSFVFGYSIEAFVGLLNNLNQMISSRWRPRTE